MISNQDQEDTNFGLVSKLKPDSISNGNNNLVNPNKQNESFNNNSSNKINSQEHLRAFLGDSIIDKDPSKLFLLQERLGKGSFGSVFKAFFIETHEVVAIKIISLIDEESVEDVRHEISILKECENSHIVKYYGAYFHGENLWVL